MALITFSWRFMVLYLIAALHIMAGSFQATAFVLLIPECAEHATFQSWPLQNGIIHIMLLPIKLNRYIYRLLYHYVILGPMHIFISIFT